MKVLVGVKVEVGDGVKVDVEVKVGETVHVGVTGRKGVGEGVEVCVIVGVSVGVAVIISGVLLKAGFNVEVAVRGCREGVTLAVGVGGVGSGANPSATNPKQ